ncbi:hypothetical protein DS893_05595 [Vibrionales bacterium C3R12]|nr:hypothetical protein DS893_05595 [Vibrionales bacterium C3R12]
MKINKKILFLLSVIIFLLSIIFAYSFYNSSGYVYIIFSVLLLTLSLSVSVFISKSYLLHSTMFSFHFFVIPQLLAVLIPLAFGDVPYYRFFGDDSEAMLYFSKYFLILSFSLLIISVFHYFGKKRRLPSIFIKAFEVDVPRFVCFLPLMLSILAFIWVMVTSGGIRIMFDNIGHRALFYKDLGVFLMIIPLGYLSSILFLLKGLNKLSFSIFIIVTIFLSLVGERGAVLFNGLLPLLLVHQVLYRKKSNRLIIISLISFFILYLLIGTIRYVSMSNNETESEVVLTKDDIVEVFSKTEHQVNAAATIKLTDDKGLFLGKPLINIIYAWVPRSFWAEKPVIAESAIIGMKLKNTNDPQGAGLPPGIISYIYANFHFIGLLLLLPIIGYMCGVVESTFVNKYNFLSLAFYSQTVSSYIYVLSTEVQVKFIFSLLFIFSLYVISVILTSRLFK